MANNVRSPRLQVLLDGYELQGAIAADVEANSYFACDRFRVRFAGFSVLESGIATAGRVVTVLVGLGAAWTPIATGLVDTVVCDPVSFTVDIEGRDFAATLIETQLEETFSNRTSSEIAQTLAARHGLAAMVTSTTTPVGRFYQSDRSRVSLGQFSKLSTEWDLLAFLAHHEGFDLFVEGQTLYFNPPAGHVGMVLAVSDCIHIQLDQSVNLSRPMVVNVKSWNTKTSESVTVSAMSAGSGPVWKRTIVRPNISASEAQQLAQQTVADSQRYQWRASVSFPGEVILTPRSQVTLVGTGTAWDRTYAVADLRRHLDVSQGYVQRMTLMDVI